MISFSKIPQVPASPCGKCPTLRCSSIFFVQLKPHESSDQAAVDYLGLRPYLSVEGLGPDMQAVAVALELDQHRVVVPCAQNQELSEALSLTPSAKIVRRSLTPQVAKAQRWEKVESERWEGILPPSLAVTVPWHGISTIHRDH